MTPFYPEQFEAEGERMMWRGLPRSRVRVSTECWGAGRGVWRSRQAPGHKALPMPRGTPRASRALLPALPSPAPYPPPTAPEAAPSYLRTGRE